MKPHAHLKVARTWAKMLDAQFSFLGFKFGLDPFISTIPIIGDGIGFVFSLYIVWIGYKLELPLEKLLTMFAHALLDFFIGSIPIFGFFADFFYGANMRNLKILEDHAASIVEGEVVI